MRLLFLILILPTLLFSQNSNGLLIEGSLDIKIPYTVRQYDTKDGLPQSQVADIATKENGNLIILTSNGIVEYNGIEFSPFIKSNTYKNYNYRHLIWHEKTKQLFAHVDREQFHLVYPKHVLFPFGFIPTIKNDSIYCIDSKGVVSIAPVSNLFFEKKLSTGIKNARCFFFYSHFYLIGTDKFLYQFDIQTKKIKELAKGNFSIMKQNPYSKSVYAIADWQIYKVSDDAAACVFDVTNKDKAAFCQNIDFINENDMFIATHHGLFILEQGKTIVYTKKDYLPSHYIQSLCYNKKEDCLFVGTAEKGLLKLQLKNAHSYYEKQGIEPTTSLNSIIETKQEGEILVSGNLGYIYKIGKDTTYHYSPNTSANGSLAEIDGVIYIGTWGSGVNLIKDHKNIGRLSAPEQLPNNSVHAAFKDSRGRIWIGTSNGIARGTSINNIKPVLANAVGKVIITFYELKNGNICIGGNQGFYILDKNDKVIAHRDFESGLMGKEIRCFYEGNDGKLWIGTYGGGLYCYDNTTLKCINAYKNAKLDADVFCLAKDTSGYFYISSNHGLWRLKEKDLLDFYDGKIEYLIPFYYGEENGIFNTEFNGGFQNNYLKSSQNKFYFPSLQGVVVVMPEHLQFRKITPVISKIFVNDTLSETEYHEFDRGTYSIQFNFYSVNFLNKYNVYYQYKLERDKTAKWSPLQKERFVSFKLLPPGRYSFSVRSIDAFNDPNPTVTTFNFEIKPYFYETTWFKLVAILVFFGLVIAVGRYRVQRYRRIAEEKEFAARKIAEIELKAIQAQLNPHFVFNCMNTIKYFLLEQDFENANKGLTKLSKLIRDSIENSEVVFSTIKGELDLIENYLELEKMRFQNQLTWNITVDPSIKQMVIIPHLFIQPFVENAIKHGIARLSSKIGVLSISLIQAEEHILTTITDNGIGREASNAINASSNLHQSKGINLIMDKKFFLKQYKNYETDIEIIDLKDTENNAIGTQVIIKTPISYSI